MDMRLGLAVSGAAHGAFLTFALWQGLFHAEPQEPVLTVSDVSLITAEEFAALTAPTPAPLVETVVPRVRPQSVEDAPPVAPERNTPPAPQAAPIVAPVSAPKPAHDAVIRPDPIAPRPKPAVEPKPEPEVEPQPKPEPQPLEAAPEAAPEIVTEADIPSGVLESSARPRTRPNRPQPPELQDDFAQGLGLDLQYLLSEAPAATNRRPSGPPLSQGEIAGFRIAVQNCWNVGSLSSSALRTTVTVAFTMDRDGRPQGGSIQLLFAEGNDGAGAAQAFEAARRAILRCGARGFDLPLEKYEHWREVEMTFNPNEMRIR